MQSIPRVVSLFLFGFCFTDYFWSCWISPSPPEKTTGVVFHLYIHIKGTSKEAEGLTVVSRKTWMHIRDTQVGSFYSPSPPTLRCFYELLSSVVRHAEKRYVTSQISTPAKTHLLLPTIRGTQKFIRQKSSGTLKDQSFIKQALFATFSPTCWKICIGYVPSVVSQWGQS